ncbi:MAG: hypothetical protein NVSMB63_16610 [Sediminibacterium sp.]
MKKAKIIHGIIVCLACSWGTAQTNHTASELKLWYNRPAKAWEEALPLGHAKTGAMVFGGNYDSAASLWRKMQGPYSARYLPLGDLWLKFSYKDTTPPTTYYRELDLNNAVSIVKYTVGDVTYQRETFISHPDKIMVVRITADKKSALQFTVSLTSKLRYTAVAQSNNLLVLNGKAPRHVANRDIEPNQIEYDAIPDGEGMSFQVIAKIIADGGVLGKTTNQLEVKGADAVTIYLSEATSFNGFNKSPGLQGKDPSIEANANLKQALKSVYAVLKQKHMADYKSLFDRVQFDLGEIASMPELPTDQRLRQFSSVPADHGLPVLYYQYGRYLMIAGTRPGSRPTNLQGIWNDAVQPPWGSNYTTNINTEMNYWPAENTNLSECHQPLFDFMKELAVNGMQTAKVNYNIQEGWVMHHNSDLWAKTSPPGGYEWDPKSSSRWSAWPMAGAWLSTHLWEHYLFTGDRKFLKEEAYPLMKGAAHFMLHWLIKDPVTGYLVTNPSTSP